jgi:hypothetical protein
MDQLIGKDRHPHMGLKGNGELDRSKRKGTKGKESSGRSLALSLHHIGSIALL